MRELTPEELRAVHHGDRPLCLPLHRVTPAEPWPVDLSAAHAASEYEDDEPRALPEGGGIVIVVGVVLACILAALAVHVWRA